MWHMASTGRGRTFTVVTCVLAMAVMAACGSAEPELPIPSLAATPPSESPKDRVYERIQGSSPLTSDEIYRLDKARLAATEAIVARMDGHTSRTAHGQAVRTAKQTQNQRRKEKRRLHRSRILAAIQMICE